MKVYNSLTGKKEKFVPHVKDEVRMYVCGLTVQNYSHLGHVRGAINYDVIRRYLRYKGYQVKYIQNFTDINEKIVARAEEEGLKPMELANKYAEAYIDDLKNLNVEMPDYFCRVSDNIPEIIEMIETLVERGHAYEAEGSVYFSVESFEDYGMLSGRKLEEMEAGSRVEVDASKRHPLDFALWKSYEEKPNWESPWGPGWPGWHIECSAMSLKYLDGKLDIHGGGTDLIFPHHENEIAQSEAYTGESPFVKYWLHNGTVDMSGEKMSKSTGNFYTTRELLEEFSANEIRYYILTKHYRSPIDFSFEELKNSRKSLKKLLNTAEELDNLLDKNEEIDQDDRLFLQEEFVDKLKAHRQEFGEAMDDDFNTARGMAVIHNLASDINSFINSEDFELGRNTRQLLREARKLLGKLAEIMGLKLEVAGPELESGKFAELVDYVVKLREEAREEKNFELADRIRDDLQKMGIEIKDTPRGPEWKLRSSDNDGS